MPPKAVAKRKPDMSALATKLEKPSSWKYSVKKTRAWNGMEPATPCKAACQTLNGCCLGRTTIGVSCSSCVEYQDHKDYNDGCLLVTAELVS